MVLSMWTKLTESIKRSLSESISVCLSAYFHVCLLACLSFSFLSFLILYYCCLYIGFACVLVYMRVLDPFGTVLATGVLTDRCEHPMGAGNQPG